MKTHEETEELYLRTMALIAEDLAETKNLKRIYHLLDLAYRVENAYREAEKELNPTASYNYIIRIMK